MIPPPAPQTLEQEHGVREASALCLHAGQESLPIRLLCIEHGEVTHPAELLRGESQIQAGLARLFRRHRGTEALRIGLERIEGVGHALEGADDRAAVLRGGLLERRLGRALPVKQRAAVENTL